MSNQDFTKRFLDYIKPGQHVLDLGAGEWKFAQMFVERGARVTAVDTRPSLLRNAMITRVTMNIEDFCSATHPDKYDLVFARNVLQFLDKYWVFETLLPWIEEHLAGQGIIGIETFYQDPEPPFDHSMRSLYALKELTTHFLLWAELYAKEYDHRGFDMSGQTRKFFVSDLIVKKQKTTAGF